MNTLVMQNNLKIFLLLFYLISACNSGGNEKISSEKRKQNFKNRTIYLDQTISKNNYTGTFKFDLSYGNSEVFYFIVFDKDLSKAKVKISNKLYYLDQQDLYQNDTEHEDVNYEEIELSDDYIGVIKVLSNDENQIKCRLTLASYDSYILYFDKKINNWYIDVATTNYDEFKSQKIVYGNRITQ